MCVSSGWSTVTRRFILVVVYFCLADLYAFPLNTHEGSPELSIYRAVIIYRYGVGVDAIY